jgi:hypothetical protein
MEDKIAWQIRFWAPVLFLACVLAEFVIWRGPAYGVTGDAAVTGGWVAFWAFLALIAVTERGSYLDPEGESRR